MTRQFLKLRCVSFQRSKDTIVREHPLTQPNRLLVASEDAASAHIRCWKRLARGFHSITMQHMMLKQHLVVSAHIRCWKRLARGFHSITMQHMMLKQHLVVSAHIRCWKRLVRGFHSITMQYMMLKQHLVLSFCVCLL
jgi:hypothetical protein